MKKISKGDLAAELASGQSLEILKMLNLLTRSGDLNADARRKLKQVNHFLGFLRPAVEDLWQRQKDPLWVDFGSGKAYLGFLAYEAFLKDRESGHLLSLDSRIEFETGGKARAQQLGFGRMKFQTGDIQTAPLPDRIHLLTALHACDTATDWAILRGVRASADWIFLVPCCQAEVASLLPKRLPGASAALYREAYHRRVFGSHLTNVIRMLTLEASGYQVTVTELTTWEHTAKGELLIAKRVKAFDQEAKENLKRLLQEFSISPRLVREMFPDFGEVL